MNSPRLTPILLVAVAGLLSIPLVSFAQTPAAPTYRQVPASDPYTQQPIPLKTSAAAPASAQTITPQTSGQQRPSQQGKPSEKSRASVSSWWMTIVALGLVLGIILVLARLLKKSGTKFSGMLGDDVFEVLGKRYLDQRQMISLVRCGHRILVLGSTINGLQTLAVIEDPVEVDYLAGLCKSQSGDTSIAQTFRALFSKQMQEDPVPSARTVNFPGTAHPTVPPARGDRRHA